MRDFMKGLAVAASRRQQATRAVAIAMFISDGFFSSELILIAVGEIVDGLAYARQVFIAAGAC